MEQLFLKGFHLVYVCVCVCVPLYVLGGKRESDIVYFAL